MSKPKEESQYTHSVYQEVSRFTHEYFGREAPQHVEKLIKVHLQKSPEELTKEELTSLMDWIKNAVSFLTEDKNAVENYIKDLINLAAGNSVEAAADQE